jgi:integrase/recombinase XerD
MPFADKLDHTRRQLTVIGKRNKLRVIDLDGWGHDEVFRRWPAKLGKPSLFWHHDGEPYKTASGRFKRLVKSVDRQAQKRAQKLPRRRTRSGHSDSTICITATPWTG